MHLIKRSEFAQLCRVTKGTITKAAQNGLIRSHESGMVDLDDTYNQSYLKDHVQRFTERAETNSDLPKIKSRANTEAAEMKKRSLFADMRRKELQVLILEKKYLPIEFIDGVYLKYCQSLLEALQKASPGAIRKAGKKILEAGEILPEQIENFTNQVLSIIHENKKSMKRFIKNYEPEIKN